MNLRRLFIICTLIVFGSFFFVTPSLAALSISRVVVADPSSTPTVTPTLTPTSNPTTTSQNHSPLFTTITNNSPKSVSSIISWSSVAFDSDSGDLVKLLICKTPNASENGCYGGIANRYCESSYVTQNPTCNYTIPVSTSPGIHQAFAFIFDQHGIGSTSSIQSLGSNFEVTNSLPVVSDIVINDNHDIYLTEGSYTPVTIKARLSDSNGCSDINKAVVSFYRSSVSLANCRQLPDTNNNSCFSNIICQPSSSCDNNNSIDFTCVIKMPYNSDPTDINTPYSTDDWRASVTAVDISGSETTFDSSTGVEVVSLIGLEIFNDNSSDNPYFNKEVTFISTGNVGQDLELKSLENINSLPLVNSYQKFTTQSNSSFANALSFTSDPQEIEIDQPKPKQFNSTSQTKFWWGLQLPSDVMPNSYSAINSFYGVRGELGKW